MNDAYKSDIPTRVNIYKLWKSNKKDVYAFDIVEYNLPASGGGDGIPHDVDVQLHLLGERERGK